MTPLGASGSDQETRMDAALSGVRRGGANSSGAAEQKVACSHFDLYKLQDVVGKKL